MKITYIEPNKGFFKRVERLFGCSYTNYIFPNIYILSIFSILEKEFNVKYEENSVFCNRRFLEKYVKNDNADIYLIYSVNLSMGPDIETAKIILEKYPDKKVIFLGPAPTYFTNEFLINKNIYVVRGEPDLAVPELAGVLSGKGELEKVKGASFLKDMKACHNGQRGLIENLDTLAFPARHLINKNRYYNPKLTKAPFTPILSSRGCGHRCIFCVPCSINFARELEYKKENKSKPPVRERSAGNVISEFELVKKQGYNAVSIIDDQFIWGKKRVLDICKGIKGLKMAWGCLCRADRLDDEIVSEMKKSGCEYIDMGIESFSQEALDFTKKDVSVSRLIEGIEALKKHKIYTKINILFGAGPYETKNTIQETIKKLERLNVDQVMFNICSPFPGTEFYDIAKQNKWIKNDEYKSIDVSSKAQIQYPNLAADELEKYIKYANRKFLFRYSNILSHLKRIKNPRLIVSAIASYLHKIIRI